MLKVKNFLWRDFTGIVCRGFLYQLFFLFTAVFLFFSLIFVVNALSLEYRAFPEFFSFDLIYIVIISPVADSFIFYLSSIFILLFPLLSRGWTESWKWAVASYLPLSLSLSGFLFQINAVGHAFLSLSCFLCLFWVFVRLTPHHLCGFNRKKGVVNILVYVCVIFLLIEIFSLFFWLQFPFFGLNKLESFFQRMAMVELQFFYVPAFLAPFLVLFTLFAWLLTPFRLWLKKVRALILRFAEKELDLKKTLSVDLNFSGFKVLDRKPWNMLFLAMTLILSVIYGFYAYHPVFYGREGFIGVDTRNYVYLLEDMRSGDFSYALSYAFFNLSDRSLSVSILYCFSNLLMLSSAVVAQFSPLVIGPLVVFATYFSMREAGFPDSICVVSGFFSSISFLMIMGVYAAFLSNMMAWVALLFFSGFLIRALRLKSWLFCLFSGVSLVSVLFLHVYTWSVMIFTLVCLGFVLFLLYVRGFPSLFNLKIVLAVVALNVISELVRHFILSIRGFSARTVVDVAQLGLSPAFISSALSSLLQIYSSGFFMTPITLFLTVIGVLTVVWDVWSKDFCLFLKFWVFAPSIFFLFGSSFVQERILYVLPFHILAALGIAFLDCWIRQHLKGFCGRIFAVLLMLLLFLVNVNYGLRSMNVISSLDFP